MTWKKCKACGEEAKCNNQHRCAACGNQFKCARPAVSTITPAFTPSTTPAVTPATRKRKKHTKIKHKKLNVPNKRIKVSGKQSERANPIRVPAPVASHHDVFDDSFIDDEFNDALFDGVFNDASIDDADFPSLDAMYNMMDKTGNKWDSRLSPIPSTWPSWWHNTFFDDDIAIVTAALDDAEDAELVWKTTPTRSSSK